MEIKKEDLKTIKDISIYERVGKFTEDYKIRQEFKKEAIKHLKYNRQVAKIQWGCEPWIMKFFNITEEDINGRN